MSRSRPRRWAARTGFSCSTSRPPWAGWSRRSRRRACRRCSSRGRLPGTTGRMWRACGRGAIGLVPSSGSTTMLRDPQPARLAAATERAGNVNERRVSIGYLSGSAEEIHRLGWLLLRELWFGRPGPGASILPNCSNARAARSAWLPGSAGRGCRRRSSRRSNRPIWAGEPCCSQRIHRRTGRRRSASFRSFGDRNAGR